ncbi:hypothetical protein [Deinococcus kurensis]|uniref:hypothetical protein n=1 Tax=Deinococcus kurensis TaxID=2662757 RepID=UPI0012D301C1|nr:hypothetical protein [Deinococcus kurensis]
MTRAHAPRARMVPLEDQITARRAAIARTPGNYIRHRTVLLGLATRVREASQGSSRAALRVFLAPIRQAMREARTANAEWLIREAVKAAARARELEQDAQARAALPTDPAAARRAGQQLAAPTGTLRQLTANRRRLIQLAWNARRDGDAHTYQELRRALDRVTRRLRAADPAARRLTPQERTEHARLRATPTPQLDREAAQRIQRDATQDQRAAQRQARDTRLRAINALAHALHGVHSGARDWQTIDTRPSTLPAGTPTGEGRGTPGASGPARLEIRVPGEPLTLHLYRADYEQLLDLWGYGTVRHALALTQQLRGAVPSAIREAEQLMMAAARHPNLARALHTYLTGPFGDVYVPHKASGSQQLGSNRSGDLREALDQLYAACKLTVHSM